jgi:3-dehydroquinate dehydratase-1
LSRAMKKPRICASIVKNDPAAVKAVQPLVDLFEVRIDLIGSGWRDVAGRIEKPWIATNRRAAEGGSWGKSEADRVGELIEAAEMGASIVDIELETANLGEAVGQIKKRAQCLLSRHDLKRTPSLESLKEIARRQIDAGADICKVVTTAQKFEDNLIVLRLIAEMPGVRVVSFAMGERGYISRVLCPLVGGDFTYASIGQGMESAPGQLTVRELRDIYGMMA